MTQSFGKVHFTTKSGEGIVDSIMRSFACK